MSRTTRDGDFTGAPRRVDLRCSALRARTFLPWSVVQPSDQGKAPHIDLVVGYHKAEWRRPMLKTCFCRKRMNCSTGGESQ